MSDDLAGRIRTACDDITAAWPEMLPTIRASRRLGTIGRSPDVVDPIAAHVFDTRADVTRTARNWTRAVLDEQPDNPGPASDDVADLVGFIRTHAEFLATGQVDADWYGPIAADELGAAARACTGIASPSAGSDRRLVGLCPACGARLDATSDRTWLTCTCGEVADIRHVRAAGRDAAQDLITPDSLCTATEAQRYGQLLDVPVDRKVLPVWVDREELDVVACRIKGRAPLYRWGDVEARATRPSGRIGRLHAAS